MKQFILYVLVLVILFPSLSFADQDLIVSSSEQLYDNVKVLSSNCLVSDTNIFIYFELQNIGKNQLFFDTDHSCVQFLDSRGNIYFEYYGRVYPTTDPSLTYTYLPIFPWVVLPGQKFFVIEDLYYGKSCDPSELEASQEILKASDYNLKLKVIPGDDWKTYPNLPVKAKYEEVVKNSYETIRLTLDITNDTENKLDSVDVVFIIRDKNGKPVLISNETVYSVDIPAYSTKHIVYDSFAFSKYEFLKQYNFIIDNVEVFVYHR